MCSGNQLWCFLESHSGGLWKMALENTTGGSGTPSTEGGLDLLFLGTLGQAAVLGWVLEVSACLCLYQPKGLLRINPTDLGSTGALCGGLGLLVFVRRKPVSAGNGAAANALCCSPGHVLSVG